MKNIKKIILVFVLGFIVNTVIANDIKEEFAKETIKEISYDEELKVEVWMIDKYLWDLEVSNSVEYIEEYDSELEIEPWMIIDCDYKVDELQLESWMFNSISWNK